MTPTERKFLSFLHKNGRSGYGVIAQHMGWGRTAQGQGRVVGSYLAKLAKKGWARRDYGTGGFYGSWGVLTSKGRVALNEEKALDDAVKNALGKP